ncbi:hypothetical protein SLS54_008563 [Diplodia seriata]
MAITNIDEFTKNGIEMKKLPLTFRHAIDFASRLGQVRFIWIDSLCIIQDDNEDWLTQSKEMGKVYNNSFLNISATAAKNGDEGLFDIRRPPLLWSDEIDLNVDGIPGMIQEQNSHPIRRCTVLDASFWTNHVDQAPLNRRGWVLQERLMAPRNVHFCKEQVAWECQCDKGRKSERHPDGFPILDKRSQRLVSSTDAEYLEAKRLLQRAPDLNHQITDEQAYRTWKQIVERYTRAKLTKPKDKLIALSGVAQRMYEKTGWVYVAGLWQNRLPQNNCLQVNLESQLLWCVEPVWDTKRQQFSYPSSRPKEYRAPCFSWAALDADQGVTYGELLDRDRILIQVENIQPKILEGDLMGGKTEGYLELTSHPDWRLKKIVLEEKVTNNGLEYGWRFLERKDANKFVIVYLDSPEQDRDIFEQDGRMYCLPAASEHQGNHTILADTGRKTDSTGAFPRGKDWVAGDITCLLLQADKNEHGTFKRVGLTVVSALDKEGEKNMKAPAGYETELPCRCCRAGKRGTVKARHTIRVK